MNRFLYLAFAGLVLLSGCKTFTGDIQVENPFTIESEEDCRGRGRGGCWPPKTETVKVPKGTHDMKISFNSSRELRLSLDLPEGDESMDLEIPANSVPDYSGTFHIESDEIEQDWGLAGTRNKEIDRSRTRRGFESCTYRERVWVCRYDNRGRRRCHYEYRTRFGRQRVEYHIKTTHDYLDVDFIEADSENFLANFSGKDVSRQKIYEYKGHCRR